MRHMYIVVSCNGPQVGQKGQLNRVNRHSSLKVSVSQGFSPRVFFHQKDPTSLLILINSQQTFQIWLRLCNYIQLFLTFLRAVLVEGSDLKGIVQRILRGVNIKLK
jgi:hypothetical protein